jgi:hypothetical protein
MSKANRNRKSSRGLTTNALVAGTLPAAVVAATTITGASAQTVAARQTEPVAPPHSAHCKKQVVKITWGYPLNHNHYLQIKNNSKKNGARVNSAKRNKSRDQEWYAHLTCEFSPNGMDLWSFQNVHSSLCIALGTSGRVYPDAVQHFCGRHFTRWTFNESPQYSFRNGHRHFLGWVLDLVKLGKGGYSLQLCDSPKFGAYFESHAAIGAGGPCTIWR